MAVHQAARHYSHDHLAPAAGGSSQFFDQFAGCLPAPARTAATAVLSGDFPFPHSDLAWCNNNNHGFLPRKRPRLQCQAAAPAAGGGFLEDQRVGTQPPACTDTGRLLPVPPPFVDARWSRAVGSGAASTSGRVSANGATTTVVAASRERILSSWTHRHVIEIDALVALETERMRAALEDARRRHAGALVAAVSRAASGRLRASETELARALRRNAELEEKARQAAAECQAWMGVARSHEAVAAGLRATLDQLLLQSPSPPPCGTDAGGGGGGGEAEAEDAQSCCFEAPAEAHGGGACASSRSTKSLACRSCGGGEACVLLLPCRHLCLCRACEATATVDACPVCSATKNGSLHVLFS